MKYVKYIGLALLAMAFVWGVTELVALVKVQAQKMAADRPTEDPKEVEVSE